jgi:hypothetical protein
VQRRTRRASRRRRGRRGDAGTYCLGNVLTVIVVDIDDNGHVVNWHPVDEVGSS